MCIRLGSNGENGALSFPGDNNGTVTREVIEKTRLTPSNTKEGRVGSELKTIVQVDDGYAIVGAEIGSEELKTSVPVPPYHFSCWVFFPWVDVQS